MVEGGLLKMINGELKMVNEGWRPLKIGGAIFVYRKPPVRPGVPKSFSDESLMVYKNLLG